MICTQMKRFVLRMPCSFVSRALAAAIGALLLASCQGGGVPPHLKPLSKEAMHLLGEKGIDYRAPVFIRIFKQESELEVWKAKSDGRFYHFKTYPICNWSGKLGPKFRQGDKQAPEGFYTVSRGQLNPNSKFYLSFNIGYPNEFDRAHGRTGSALMVHGDCRSAGCYAMTDALIEEIYALVRDAFRGGQKKFHVHAYPFRMTPQNMRKYRRHPSMPFWRTMKEGYDYFEQTRIPPVIHVCDSRYLVNVRFVNPAGDVTPTGACPIYEKMDVTPWRKPVGSSFASLVTAPGRKVRDRDFARPGSGATAYGLTRVPSPVKGTGRARSKAITGLGFDGG